MAIERHYSVRELAELTGLRRRAIYDAMARGELAYVIPNGCTKGRRVAESEARRWVGSITRRG